MAANRWAFHLLLAAGLPTVPACLPVPRADQGPPATITGQPGPTQFAVLPTAPGERVALHKPDPTEDPPTEADPPRAQQTGGPGGVVPPQPLSPSTITVPADPPLVAAVRAYLEGRPEQAVEHLKALDRPNQDLMLQLIPPLVRASQMNLTSGSPVEIGALARELEAPAAALAARSPLAIEKAVFCRDVKNFGRYAELPERYGFKPGALAELYVEVRNVPSEPASTPAEGDGYVTKLACTLQVRDAGGNVIDLPDRNRRPVPTLYEAKRDFTRSPIRDYFLLFRFPVPAKSGGYTVTFEVRDPASGRAVSRTMPFRVQ